MQYAIDRHIRQSGSGATDLSEIAQQSAGEAIASLAGMRTENLFGGSSADVQAAMHSLSTKKGFGELGQRFFGRFMARFLNFYLSRVTVAKLSNSQRGSWGTLLSSIMPCECTATKVRASCATSAVHGTQRRSMSRGSTLRTHQVF